MQSNSNSRAQLLSGLRTGGVRSTSQPSIVPHTAAIGGSFNVPRFASFSQPQFLDEEDDELADMVSFGMQLNGNHRMQQPPMSASAADGMGNRFQQQQQQQQAFMRQMAAQRSAMNGMGVQGMNAMAGMDPLQMQVMQIELMKLQAIQQAQQAQQFQAELIAQAQRQQQPAQRGPSGRRGSAYNEPPATAGPTSLSFDMRGQSNGHFDVYDQDEMQVPMTAALGGKFGSRPVLSALNPNASVFTLRGDGDEPPTPKTAVGPGRTTVISGGTSLGAASSAVNTPVAATPTKSDSATSWRRGSAASTGQRASPSIKLTPPSGGSDVAPSPLKTRPSPLRFGDNGNAFPAVNGAYVEIESGTESDADSYTSDLAQLAASASEAERESSPSTPPSAGSSGSLPSREEASKRLYEGLGMGRPVQTYVPPVYAPARQISQVLRQPRGPPASVDELGPRNFAARLQLKMMAEALAAGEL